MIVSFVSGGMLRSIVKTALRAVAPRTPWLDTDTSQPLSRKARSGLAGYASATGTPPGVLPCPEPNTPLSPKATIVIVSAPAGAEAIADRTTAIARAAQCRITSPPTHPPDPGGFERGSRF